MLGFKPPIRTVDNWLGGGGETRKYRQFTPEQKTEIVLAGLWGDRSVQDVCREYEIAETLYYYCNGITTATALGFDLV